MAEGRRGPPLTGRPDSPGPLRRSTPRTRRLEAAAPCAEPPRRRRPGSEAAECETELRAAARIICLHSGGARISAMRLDMGRSPRRWRERPLSGPRMRPAEAGHCLLPAPCGRGAEGRAMRRCSGGMASQPVMARFEPQGRAAWAVVARRGAGMLTAGRERPAATTGNEAKLVYGGRGAGGPATAFRWMRDRGSWRPSWTRRNGGRFRPLSESWR